MSNDYRMEFEVFFDFEYNDRQVILCRAMVDNDPNNMLTFDLRDGKDTEKLREFIDEAIRLDLVFVSYALAAEIDSLLRLGIDVTKMEHCIDLMAECRMLTQSSVKYFEPTGSLLGHLQVLLGHTVDKKHKDDMRDLIIHQDSWNDEEWSKIVDYCGEDITYLPQLKDKLAELFTHDYTQESQLIRGRFVRVCAEMDFASKGFPVYGGDLAKIYERKADIKSQIIEELPEMWRDCYVKAKGGNYQLKAAKLKALVQANPEWSKVWPVTPGRGNPSTADEVLDRLKSGAIPEVATLLRVRRTTNTLNSRDLTELITADGYVKPKTFSFSAKTGRNGLRPKQGYLLNLPSWMRGAIRPHPGHVMVGVDWSQQEIAIAAKLSADDRLMTAYESGDVYLALGKMSGDIPEDGTKKSHPGERDMFKTLQLALAYGKELPSITLDFITLMTPKGFTKQQATIKAAELYRWHHKFFHVYWSWINSEVNKAYNQGYMSIYLNDWVLQVTRNRTRKTQLLNFPMQAMGAALMRQATINIYNNDNPEPIICSQHDAFYMSAVEEDADMCAESMVASMDKACADLDLPIIRTDISIYTSEDGYCHSMSESNKDLWSKVLSNK